MNAYEITLIIRPDLDEEGTKSAAYGVTGRLESTGAEILSSYPWSPARRRMAYPIKDFGDGFYFTATFRYDPTLLREFETFLKLNTNILRYLLVAATDLALRNAQQRMNQLAAAAAAPPPPPPVSQGPPGAPAGAAPAPQPSLAPQVAPDASIPAPQPSVEPQVTPDAGVPAASSGDANTVASEQAPTTPEPVASEQASTTPEPVAAVPVAQGEE